MQKTETIEYAHGYKPYIDDDGKVTVFFGSTYAPECDSWVHWE